ncbi:polysaccharide biosynthesis tyrosine autokinase [Ancylobacter sp. SL191]|uniref:polysaccharide biosynthesis tyrosine autokinase n=1 Tax=Ancylobacter sp. SL191 TaxID=2995166 RepID=UPI00226EC80E|nr:polysaccharide biosynthesis tyrosine autokinase [Ancylobacter sp. SL191]WAC25953.1 polysaccharide biosynthesis tyrosine autokinase [Ancylobacter sp. SL191]
MHGQIADYSRLEESGRFDLHHVVDFLLRRWSLMLMVAVTVLASAFVVYLTITPTYTSTAEVLLDSSSRVGLGEDLSPLGEKTVMDDQIAIITSVNFLKRVVDHEKLNDDDEFGKPELSILTRLKMLVGLGAEPAPVGAPQAASGDDVDPVTRGTIGRLKLAMTIARKPRSSIITIAVTSESRVKAARIANAIADAYITDQLESRFDAARRASSWLTERLQSLRDALRASEEAVVKFRSENNLVSVGSKTLNDQQLSEVNAELVQIQTEAAAKKAKYEQARELVESGGKVDAIPDVIRSAVISDLRGRLASVSAREADLVSRYGERHPLVVNVRAERREIERLVNTEIQRIIVNLKNDYDVAQTRADAMEANVAAASGQAGTESGLTIRLRELERDAQANRTLYETFLTQAKLTSERSEVNIQDAQIITPALPAGAPTAPSRSLFLGAGAALGLVVGFGVALLLDLLNSGFTSPRQVEEQTGLPVLSSVEWADFPEMEAGGAVPVLKFLVDKPLSRFSESIRSLRAGVQMSDVDNPPQVVEITSASPGEGKTSLAISLAVSAATSGKRALLIDCDLRRPSISQQFGLTDRPGLVELLAQTASAEGILHRDKLSGVYVLGSGAKTQSPPDLLGSARMQHLIDQLRQSFDLIIVDAPPIGPVADASVLAAVADKVVFVVRWGVTAREFVRHSLERIPGDRKVCGIAFNMVDLRRTPRYGRYSYYSSAYYKKYYVG